MSKKKRGVLLTAWLVLMIIVNAFASVTYFFLTSLVVQAFPQIRLWVVYSLGALTTLNIVFAVLMLNWKKFGFYATIGTSVIAFVLNLFTGMAIIMNFLGFLSPLILYMILKPKWELFE